MAFKERASEILSEYLTPMSSEYKFTIEKFSDDQLILKIEHSVEGKEETFTETNVESIRYFLQEFFFENGSPEKNLLTLYINALMS